MTDPAAVITAENINQFTPAKETLSEAKHALEELGFTTAHSGVTLTLTGSRATFEEVFKIKLSDKKGVPKGRINTRAGEEPAIPDSLKGLVEKVIFPEPPRLFP